MLSSLVALLAFQILGEVVVRSLGLVVPGPVLGMFLLFVALLLRPGLHPRVQQTSHILLRNLSLFFVPAGVGVMTLLPELRRQAVVLAAVIVVSTWVTALVSALVFEWVRKKV